MSTSRPPSRTCAMRSCCGEVSSWRRGASLATHSARDLCCSAGGEREQNGRRWGSGVRTELPVPNYGRVGAVYGDLRHGGGGRQISPRREIIIGVDVQTFAKWVLG